MVAERRSDLKLTTDTQYLALSSSKGVSVVRIVEKIDCVIMAPHCTHVCKLVYCNILNGKWSWDDVSMQYSTVSL